MDPYIKNNQITSKQNINVYQQLPRRNLNVGCKDSVTNQELCSKAGYEERGLTIVCWKWNWWSGIVVSALASINKVNLRRARLVLTWATVSGSIPGAGHLFQYVTNQPPKANSAFHPSGVGKWVPASAGKAKAGMVHSINRWMWGVQVKLWDLLRTRAIPQHLRGVFTTRCYTNPCLPLPLPYLTGWCTQ